MSLNSKDKIIQLLRYVGECDRKQIEKLTGLKSSTIQKAIIDLKDPDGVKKRIKKLEKEKRKLLISKQGNELEKRIDRINEEILKLKMEIPKIKSLINSRTFKNTRAEKYSLSGKSLIKELGVHREISYDLNKTDYCVDQIIKFRDYFLNENEVESVDVFDFLVNNLYINYNPTIDDENKMFKKDSDLIFKIHHKENENAIKMLVFVYVGGKSIEEDFSKIINLTKDIEEYEIKLNKEGKFLYFNPETDFRINGRDKSRINSLETRIKKMSGGGIDA